MNIFFTILFFVIGLVIGSFLNVIICRYNTGRSIKGRSKCMSCQNTLCWYEMIPLSSFIVQAGRCRNCKTKISFQYPMVELVTGIIFVSLYARYSYLLDSPWLMALSVSFFSALFSLLMIISVYDLKHKIVPNGIAYPFVIISFLGMFFFGGDVMSLHWPAYYDFLIGPAMGAFFGIFWLVSKGRWMGLGDAKLALGLGFMLGLEKGIAALIISFWLGAIYGVGLMIFSKDRYSMKSEIPFAPFLVLGALIAFLFAGSGFIPPIF